MQTFREIEDNTAQDGELGPFIETVSGRLIHFYNIQKDQLIIEDIAHSLSQTCRFNGHCIEKYYNAEHSYNVYLIIKNKFPKNYQLQLDALMHDSGESILCDLPSDVKIVLNDYKSLEKHVEKQISDIFNLNYPWHKEIKIADLQCLLSEKKVLMPNSKIKWKIETMGLDDANIKIKKLSSKKAKELFLKTFYELKNKIDNS